MGYTVEWYTTTCAAGHRVEFTKMHHQFYVVLRGDGIPCEQALHIEGDPSTWDRDTSFVRCKERCYPEAPE